MSVRFFVVSLFRAPSSFVRLVVLPFIKSNGDGFMLIVAAFPNDFYVHIRSGSRGHSGDLSDRSSQRDRVGRGGPSYR